MNPNNRKEETIRYREPFSTSFRRRQRQFTGVNYDDRSPKVVAMNAHLGASAYGQGRRSSRPTYDLEGAEVATIRTGGRSETYNRAHLATAQKWGDEGECVGFAGAKQSLCACGL